MFKRNGRLHDSWFHKLKQEELEKFLPEADVKRIVERSLARKPLTHDKNPVVIHLNKPKTIWVQSIHYYGGENFNEPYFFVAEITHWHQQQRLPALDQPLPAAQRLHPHRL